MTIEKLMQDAKTVLVRGNFFVEKVDEMKRNTEKHKHLIPKMKRHPEFEKLDAEMKDLIKRLHAHLN